MDEDNDWVAQVIGKLQSSSNGLMEIQVGNSTVGAVLEPEFVKFFETNKVLLLKIGIDLFTEFVSLVHQKRNEEAFDLLAAQMDVDEIISKINLDADGLQQHNDERDKFEQQLEAFAISLVTSAASKIVLAALGL